MSTLTLRISDAEKTALARRAKLEGTTIGALVRRMIQAQTFTTAADLLAEMDSLMGNLRLANRKPR